LPSLQAVGADFSGPVIYSWRSTAHGGAYMSTMCNTAKTNQNQNACVYLKVVAYKFTGSTFVNYD